MTHQMWVKHVKECWAACPALVSRVIMSFALALAAEAEGDLEKAEERLAKAIEIEAETS